jgi:hypothetical protein
MRFGKMLARNLGAARGFKFKFVSYVNFQLSNAKEGRKKQSSKSRGIVNIESLLWYSWSRASELSGHRAVVFVHQISPSLPLAAPDSSVKYGGRSLPHYRVSVPIRGVFFQQLTPLHSGTGYIGSFTALALLEAGYKVVIADNLYNSSEEVLNRIELICGKRPDFVSLDVKDEEAFDDVFSKHPEIDSVIHFAALKVRLVADNITRPKPRLLSRCLLAK